jgi:hypothetical protein
MMMGVYTSLLCYVGIISLNSWSIHYFIIWIIFETINDDDNGLTINDDDSVIWRSVQLERS